MNAINKIAANEQHVPALFVKDGQVFANSRDVAKYFEKRHDNVLADIRAILPTPEISGMGLFLCVQTPHPTVVGRIIQSYDMTKDGFTLLVMGYTGQKAMQFKVAYIQRFNEMEEALHRQPVPPQFDIPQTLPQALRLAADLAETVDRLTIENTAAKEAIAEMTPKAALADKLCSLKGAFCLTVGPLIRVRLMCIVTHVDSRAIIKALEVDGWEHKRTTGSHWHFKHPSKSGLVTVPHPKRDLPSGTVRAIERQSGLQLLR